MFYGKDNKKDNYRLGFLFVKSDKINVFKPLILKYSQKQEGFDNIGRLSALQEIGWLGKGDLMYLRTVS